MVHIHARDDRLAVELAVAFGRIRPRGGRRPRLLLFGNYGQGNLGDEAILAGLLRALEGAATVVVVSREPARVRQLHGVGSVSAFSPVGVSAMLRADVVGIGGGGIFGNGMTLLPRLLPVLALGLRALGIRTMFLAIGAYRSTPSGIQFLLRLLAGVSSLVTARDQESVDVLGHGAILVPDPGLSLPAASPDAARALLRAAGVPLDRPLLGLSLKPATEQGVEQTQHLLAQAAIAAWCGATGGDVVLFCLSERGNFGLGLERTDATLGARVVADGEWSSQTHLVGPDVEPALMKGAVGLMDAVVAHRLHAQIFATATGRPMIGMSYEHKADAFLSQTGTPRLDLRGHPEAALAQLLEWLAPHLSSFGC